MNYRGSWRHLIGSSRSALLSAIEIYNKPRIAYRDETFVILLLAAWELALKALISKNRGSIYERKKRGRPYRTIAFKEALDKAQDLVPRDMPKTAIRENLLLLETYRNQAVHFYNQSDFSKVVYGLAQPCITNYADLAAKKFKQPLAKDITWQLLPLGLATPVDPVQYLGQARGSTNRDIEQFIGDIARSAREVEASGEDSSRLFTDFRVSVESTKRLRESDVVVGLGTGSGEIVFQKVDPNKSFPLLRRDVIKKIGSFQGTSYSTPYLFDVLSWHLKIKDDKKFCWKSQANTYQYSEDLVAYLRKLSPAELGDAVVAWTKELKRRKQQK